MPLNVFSSSDMTINSQTTFLFNIVTLVIVKVSLKHFMYRLIKEHRCMFTFNEYTTDSVRLFIFLPPLNSVKVNKGFKCKQVKAENMFSCKSTGAFLHHVPCYSAMFWLLPHLQPARLTRHQWHVTDAEMSTGDVTAISCERVQLMHKPLGSFSIKRYRVCVVPLCRNGHFTLPLPCKMFCCVMHAAAEMI